jgi:metal-responsive CopG/Arc/MetJ family transcriptional regulator
MQSQKNRRVKIDITIDPFLLNKIDALRGREKRSTFVEHLLNLGLARYVGTAPRRQKAKPKMVKEA